MARRRRTRARLTPSDSFRPWFPLMSGTPAEYDAVARTSADYVTVHEIRSRTLGIDGVSGSASCVPPELHWICRCGMLHCHAAACLQACSADPLDADRRNALAAAGALPMAVASQLRAMAAVAEAQERLASAVAEARAGARNEASAAAQESTHLPLHGEAAALAEEAKSSGVAASQLGKGDPDGANGETDSGHPRRTFLSTFLDLDAEVEPDDEVVGTSGTAGTATGDSGHSTAPRQPPRKRRGAQEQRGALAAVVDKWLGVAHNNEVKASADELHATEAEEQAASDRLDEDAWAAVESVLQTLLYARRALDVSGPRSAAMAAEATSDDVTAAVCNLVVSVVARVLEGGRALRCGSVATGGGVLGADVIQRVRAIRHGTEAALAWDKSIGYAAEAFVAAARRGATQARLPRGTSLPALLAWRDLSRATSGDVCVSAPFTGEADISARGALVALNGAAEDMMYHAVSAWSSMPRSFALVRCSSQARIPGNLCNFFQGQSMEQLFQERHHLQTGTLCGARVYDLVRCDTTFAMLRLLVTEQMAALECVLGEEANVDTAAMRGALAAYACQRVAALSCVEWKGPVASVRTAGDPDCSEVPESETAPRRFASGTSEFTRSTALEADLYVRALPCSPCVAFTGFDCAAMYWGLRCLVVFI